MLLDANKFEVAKEKHPVWCKWPAIAEAMKTYPSAEWVWWLDLDAIIMTPHLNLHDYLLGPEVMKSRLLIGEIVVSNNRIKVDSKPLDNLRTGEVCIF